MFNPSPAPDAPSTARPATFAQDADNFTAWQAGFGAGINNAGGLLTPGDFGLGARRQPSLAGDVFQENGAGVYYARPPSSGGASDTPFGANFHVWKSQREEGYQAAILIPQFGAPDAYLGLLHDGVQTPWARLFHSENVVGTVTRDAGKVTGAVVQSGSGPGGHWRRFADGTQECWVTSPEVVADTQVGSRYISAAGWDWTFPAAFSSTPTVHTTARRWTGAHAHSAMLGSGSFGISGCKLLLSTEFQGATGFLHGYAIGRWD